MPRHISLLLSGGGQMGELIRTFDWSQTDLGPIEQWPQSLLTIINTCLHSRFPFLIWWGPSLTAIYNDAYIPIFSGKHPMALGKPGKEAWGEVWPIIGPMLQQVAAGGEATWSEDQFLLLHRKGFLEETYFTWSYSPIPIEGGQVGGILTSVTEVTTRVLGERRLKTLRELGTIATKARTVEEACLLSAECLSANQADLPFVLLYLCDHQQLSLKASMGIASAHHTNKPWPITPVLQTNKILLVNELAQYFTYLPTGLWDQAPTQAAILPIAATDQEKAPIGAMVVGLSPCLEFNEEYRGFLDLISGHLSSALATARAYEEERKRAEALAEIDRAKTTFFSNVSHEFRTPLTLMLGPLEENLAERTALPPLHYQREELAYRNALRLLKLVNSLLDFSRIEAGRTQAVFEAIDLTHLTLELTSMFHSAIEKADLQLLTTIDELSEPVYVDREMWEKIVLNLLSNAFKFTFHGSIHVSLKQIGKHIELIVQDTGTGIPEHELPHLFKRFHRIEGAHGRSHEGTGIGLALIQELVHMHGGSIQVNSQLGIGSTFTVCIPLGNKHLPEACLKSKRENKPSTLRNRAFVEEVIRWLPSDPDIKLPLTPSLPLARSHTVSKKPFGNILLADDNADMRDYVKGLLNTTWHIDTVADGEMAYQAALQHDYDLIISDIMMPKLDGFGLIKKLKQHPKTQPTPIILLSARAGEEAKIEGLQAGADDYLVKPFSAKELLARVTTQLKLIHSRRELELERKKLRSLIMQAPTTIVILKGPEHIYDLCNPAGIKLLGGRDITGLPIREALPELKGTGYFEALDNVYRTGKPYRGYEMPMRLGMPDGTIKEYFFDFIYEPWREFNQNITGIFVVAIDVTDRVKSRLIIEESENYFRTLVDNSPALLWMTNAAGVCNYLSQQWFEFTGYQIQANLNGWLESIHPEDLHTVSTLFSPDSPKQEIISREYRLRCKDGQYRWVLAKANSRYDNTGHFLGYIGTLVDISELKQTQSALQNALKARDEFLSIASHELKTPITSLKLQLQMTQRRLNPLREIIIPLSDKLIAALDNATIQVDRLTHLIEDLLDVSRIQANKMGLKKEETNLSLLLAEIMEHFNEQLLSVHTQVNLQIQPNIICYCDRSRIEQVIVNLISNAIKYAADAPLQVSLYKKDEQAKLIVKDYGPGIPLKKQARIFERFERAIASRNISGLGLGLFISKNIIDAHQGEITVQSEPGKGAAFIVTLKVC